MKFIVRPITVRLCDSNHFVTSGVSDHSAFLVEALFDVMVHHRLVCRRVRLVDASGRF